MAYLDKKLALLLITFIFVSCSTVKPRKPQFAVVKQIGIVDKKTSAYVGIFIPKLKEKTVRYSFVKDDTNADTPPVIIISLKNADVANTPIPESDDLKTNALYKISSRYEDVENTTRGYISLHLTNDYPFEVKEKPFGYEVKIVKNKPPREEFLRKTREESKETLTAETSDEETPEETEESAEVAQSEEATPISTPSFESSEPVHIENVSFEQGNRLILHSSVSLKDATINLVSSQKYLLRIENSTIAKEVVKKLNSIQGKYVDSIQSMRVETNGGKTVSIYMSVKREVYPVLKHNSHKTMIKFEKLLPPMDDFGSYLFLNKEILAKKINLNLKNAKVYDALKLLASYTKTNFVIDRNIPGRLTLQLKNISWDAAFTTVLQSHQLGFVREKSDIIRIAQLSTLLKEKQLAFKTKKVQKSLEEKDVAVFPLSYIETSQLKGKIKNFLSEEGNLIIDNSSNTLMVYDHPSNLRNIYALLESADHKRPLVHFTAQIIEAPLNFHKEIDSHIVNGHEGQVKNKEELESLLQEAESSNRINRVSLPDLSTLDRKRTSVTASLKKDEKKTTFKLSVLPRIAENQEILLDIQFEKEHPLSDKDEIYINAKTHLLVPNEGTAMVGGFNSSGKEFFILITPTIKAI